jgi:predicted protein tyrosine phosphatase
MFRRDHLVVDGRRASRYRGRMTKLPDPIVTICGLEELGLHGASGVTHVVSILDPGQPEPEAFAAYDPHQRAVLWFHDIIDPAPGMVLPTEDDVRTVLAFGEEVSAGSMGARASHILVHCTAGISRSSAVVAVLLAQREPDRDEDSIFEEVVRLRPKAWPNSCLIAFADDLLSRGGRLNRALARHYQRQLVTFPFVMQYMRDNGRAREVDMATDIG